MDLKLNTSDTLKSRFCEDAFARAATNRNPWDKVLADNGLGVGVMGTTTSSLLIDKTAPRIFDGLAKMPRLFGGVLSASIGGAEVIKTFKNDFCMGNENYSETKKVALVTAGTVGAGAVTGALVGGAYAAAIALGATPLAIAGIGAAGIGAVGYATHKARQYLTQYFDR